jgi:hypothetical protein
VRLPRQFAKRGLCLPERWPWTQEVESGREFLHANTDLMKAIGGHANSVFDELRAREVGLAVDPDGLVSDLLGQAADSVRRSREATTAKYSAARRLGGLDQQLEKDYLGFLDVAADIHSAIEDMREWVETHDALLEKPSGRPMKSASELFSRLGIRNAA